MIKVLEQDYLQDDFINKQFVSNIKSYERLKFTKNNIYYFGNYTKEGLSLIKQKLIKNKNAIKRAIENNVKFIICGNSTQLFNNSFNHNDLNIFTSYNKNIFKRKIKGIKFKKNKSNKKIKSISNLNNVIDEENFRYKNLICIKDIKKILRK